MSRTTPLGPERTSRLTEHWLTGASFTQVFQLNDTAGRCLPDPDVFVAGGGIVGSAGCEASLLSLASLRSDQVFYASPSETKDMSFDLLLRACR